MDSATTLLNISKLSSVLDVLHKEHSKLLLLRSQVQLGIFPDNVDEKFPPSAHTSFSEVQESYLEDISDRLLEICTKINRANDAIDKLDPPATLYFKRKGKTLASITGVSFDPEVRDPLPTLRPKKPSRRRRRNPFNFIPQFVDSIR
jgi:hypothetical protein